MKILPASWRWRLALAAAAALGLWLGHGPLLRALAAPLVSEQSSKGAAAMALRGDERGGCGAHAFDMAAAFYRHDPARHIILIGRRPGRLVELGILTSFATLGPRELARRGVPEAAVEVVHATAADQWEEAEILAAWLQAHPTATVTVYCNPLGSRRLRDMLDRTAAPADAVRARILIPHDAGHDAMNWWQSRAGIKDFMLSWLQMAFARSQERHPPLPPQQSVAAYQKMLSEAFSPQSK
jgi:hypothetical protein